MKFKYGMWFVAVVGSILLCSASAWAQTQPMRRQSNPIAAGYAHTCALRTDGAVWCWGDNQHGELGNGTHRDSLIPVRVDLGSSPGVVAIAVGYAHTCALRTDGSVKCWGQNNYGQLGDGTRVDRTTPVEIGLGGGRAVAIAAGWFHTCALMANGTVKCWGRNQAGQLGDGTTRDRTTSVKVNGLSRVVAIAAGWAHTCAVLVNGTAKCWGKNKYGQLGISSGGGSLRRGASDLDPSTVSNLSGAVAITAGESHTCALKANGKLWCWGRNQAGQLGDGTQKNRETPVAVKNLSGAVAISAKKDSTCALLANGTEKCWGQNNYGQLGNATLENSVTPVAVSGLSNAVAIAAGSFHACALLADGAAKCWGLNKDGQLGDPDTGYVALSPVTVVMKWGALLRGYGALDLAAGSFHTCAVLADGTVKCWGDNSYGQLGDGNSGLSLFSATPVTVSGLSDAVAIASGSLYSCALRADGKVWCWGSNSYGQLGDDGTEAFSAVPVMVSGLSNAVAISTGANHTCALKNNGKLWCWGRNNYGQLGNGSTASMSALPAVVSGLSDAVAISTGDYHTCAVLVGGGARCWGSNNYGQLGNGSTASMSALPVVVSGMTNAVTIAAGDYHTCAVLVGGGARCWGWNNLGQLGNGSTASMSALPVVVSGMSNAVAISAGGYHTCAALADGTAQCWGLNKDGQLGDGSSGLGSNSSVPVTVADWNGALPDNVAGIAAGGYHSCYLASFGGVRCWGDNSYGQLGDRASAGFEASPVSVTLSP